MTQISADGRMGWADASPGSSTPGQEMGMLRIPQECASWRMRGNMPSLLMVVRGSLLFRRFFGEEPL